MIIHVIQYDGIDCDIQTDKIKTRNETKEFSKIVKRSFKAIKLYLMRPK